jgi:hypothetical protein
MANIYVQVLIQWLFFFGIIGIIILPALLFRVTALRNNKKGWLFFIAGLALGFAALSLSRVVATRIIGLIVVQEQYKLLVSALFLVIGYGIDFLAVIFFRRSVESTSQR